MFGGSFPPKTPPDQTLVYYDVQGIQVVYMYWWYSDGLVCWHTDLVLCMPPTKYASQKVHICVLLANIEPSEPYMANEQ